MNIAERISLFYGMISCNYNVYIWTCDKEMNILESNYPSESNISDIVAFFNFSETLLERRDSLETNPLILDTSFGLVWIAAFEYKDNELYRIYILGSVFTGQDSQKQIRKKLDSHGISLKLQMEFMKQLEDVPIMSNSILVQFAVMFHYCITGEKISVWDVQFKTNGDFGKFNEPKLVSEEHAGIWVNEQRFLQLIREGNDDYKKVLAKSMTLSNGVKADFGDNLRHHKNNVHTLLTLCSRASIEGGLAPSIAYTLNDYYAKVIEDCRNVTETSATARKIMDDYVQRVQKSKAELNISGQILDICEYISANIKEKISLSDLAERAGYTEYYLSHKFKEDMGQNINEYIRQKKIEEAKILLAGTQMSVLEISIELSFSNRSYFYSCFQKETGMAPTEYRCKFYKF